MVASQALMVGFCY